MICTNNKINKVQLTVILMNAIIGLEILSLPHSLAEKVGTDGWIVILISGFLATVLTLIINSTSVNHPEKSMVEFGRELVPTPIADIISAIYMVEFIIIGGIILQFFGEVINTFLLSETPHQVICITMIFLAVYMARTGIEPMGRLFIIVTLILMIPTVIIGFSILPDINIDNYFPIFETSPKDILKTIPRTVSSFSGFQILFFITHSVKEDKKNLKKYNLIGMVLVILFYLSVYMVTVGKYGVNKLKAQLWPVMSLMRSIQIPSTFLENIDALVMSVWIVSVFAALSIMVYGSSFIGSKILRTDEMRPFVIPFGLIIYFLGNLEGNISDKLKYSDKMVSVTSIFTILIVPIMYFMISKIKNNKRVDTDA